MTAAVADATIEIFMEAGILGFFGGGQSNHLHSEASVNVPQLINQKNQKKRKTR
jgi:hypothetical protein